MALLDEPEALLRKIRLGEDSVLELKRVVVKGNRVAAPARKELADELAAFANARGGLVVLGVDDRSREILGIPLAALDAVEDHVRELVNDSVEPPLLAHIVRLELPAGDAAPRPVLAIEVPRSLFVHKSPGGYFHRVGSSKRELRPEVLARLFQQRSQARIVRFEEQAVPGTSLDDLSSTLWQPLLGSLTEDPRLTLRKLKILTDDDGRECATVAGILLCSRHPDQWLAGAAITAVRYRRTLRDPNEQTDAAQITGPLDEQIRAAFAFFRRNMTVAATKPLARTDHPQFSERAAFEAIVNAVAHRDYSIYGSKIRLFMFSDRLELYSPGSLPNTLTIESLPFRQATRNELVTSLLARRPVEDDVAERAGRRYFMEKRGDGVPLILRESRELSGRDPIFRLIDDSELLLTIFSAELPNQLEPPTAAGAASR